MFIFPLLSEASFSHFTSHDLCLVKRFRKHYSRKLSYQISSFPTPSLSAGDVLLCSHYELYLLHMVFVNTAVSLLPLASTFLPKMDCPKSALAVSAAVSFLFP